MKCSNCGLENAEGSVFCAGCGNKLEVEKAPALFCANCGRQLSPKDAFCPLCGTSVSRVEEQVKKPEPVKKKDNSKALMVVAILLAAFALSVLGGFFYLNSGFKINEKPQKPERTQIAETQKPTQKPEKTEEPEETKEPTLKPTKAPTPEPTEEPFRDIYDFPFSFNEPYIDAYPTYKRINNGYYSYYCAIPKHFITFTDGVYYAPDNTAVMTVYAEDNYEGLSVDDAMYAYIAEVGGKVTYSASGEEWFAVSMEKDGISYYRKCYVDHYIRSFSFNFPKEYIDVYDDYINYIEDNFKRTDV